MTVAVVGAGIMGASAARFLARRGHQVEVFDPRPVGRGHGSSHGRSRIVRRTYPDPFFTAVMGEGYPMWHDLARELQTPLLHECGLLYFGPAEDPEIRDAMGSLVENAVPHKILDPGAAAKVMPGLRLLPEEVAVYTEDGGWVDPEAAVNGSLFLAQRYGAVLHGERVADLAGLEADVVVVTAGPWVRSLVGLDVTVTRQTVAYFAGRLDGPVWIEASPHHPYGFPSEPGQDTFKVALHHPGPETDPDAPAGDPDPSAIAGIRDAVLRRFGQAPEIVETVACLYTNRADEGFCVFWHDARTLVVSACSGHGFKFGPWLGQFVADVVDRRRDLSDWPEFAP